MVLKFGVKQQAIKQIIYLLAITKQGHKNHKLKTT